jgi:cyanophycinase-like exopeptidase
LFYEDGKATVLGKGGVFVVDLSRAIEKSKLFFAA